LDANGSGLSGEVCAAEALDEGAEGVAGDAEGGGREHPVDADLQRVDVALHALAHQRLGNPCPAGHPQATQDPHTGNRRDRTAGRAGSGLTRQAGQVEVAGQPAAGEPADRRGDARPYQGRADPRDHRPLAAHRTR
jgi:hypothetical protein